MEINSIASKSQLTASGETSQEMGKEDFLNLLVLQMRNQDPLNPMDNQAMLAQMAQFSSLEQMSNLNDTMQSANQLNAFMDATRLLGKNITISDPTSSADSPTTLNAKVESISYSTQGPVLTLNNGMRASIGQVIEVSEPAS